MFYVDLNYSAGGVKMGWLSGAIGVEMGGFASMWIKYSGHGPSPLPVPGIIPNLCRELQDKRQKRQKSLFAEARGRAFGGIRKVFAIAQGGVVHRFLWSISGKFCGVWSLSLSCAARKIE